MLCDPVIVSVVNNTDLAEHFASRFAGGRLSGDGFEDEWVCLNDGNDRVGVVQTAVLEAGNQLEPLWLSLTSEPILLAGQIQGQSLVVLGCEPARSENLPLLASYPLLIGTSECTSLETKQFAFHQLGWKSCTINLEKGFAIAG